MKHIKYLFAYIPITALLIAMVYCVQTAASTYIVFTWRNYLAVAALITCIVLLFLNARKGKAATLITLLLGTFDVIAFTPVRVTTSIWVKVASIGLEITFQHFSLWILLLFFLVNLSSLPAVRNKLLQPKVYPDQVERERDRTS